MNAAQTFLSNRVEPEGLDYFPSAPWHGRMIGEVLARLGLPLGRVVHEPAAGEGHLAHGLADCWPVVMRSDIWPHVQRDGAALEVRDYLASDPARSGWRDVVPDWTVTNPPFGGKTTAFIERACATSAIGVVMLLQLRKAEGPGMLTLFRRYGLYAKAVIPRRGSGIRKGVWVPGQDHQTAYALFVFVRPGVVPGWAGFVDEARTIWIEPDACDRLSRDSDQIFAGVRP